MVGHVLHPNIIRCSARWTIVCQFLSLFSFPSGAPPSPVWAPPTRAPSPGFGPPLLPHSNPTQVRRKIPEPRG